MGVTRLAPSPTGALHLGNARTFLVNWLIARQSDLKILLRVEDLDGPRIRRGAAEQAMEDLAWMGIDFDEGPIFQSHRMEHYRAAIDRLIESGHVYPCICTRREVDAAASAPHADDGASVYPGTCRDRFATIEAARHAAAGRAPALRFRVPDRKMTFHDAFAGQVSFDVARQLGDFVVAKADGTPAYQLAVVVDDAAMGITHVVRGDDLLDSTPRQILLYEALGLAQQIPAYTHLPLVVGPDGRRLAKRHGDTRLSYYRERGVRAGKILALLARWSGIETNHPIENAADLISAFRLDALPRTPIVFNADDERPLFM